MTPIKTVIVATAFIGALLVSGCGLKEADKERARLELEEKARRETEVGNKAITDLNQRMFGKKPTAPTGKDSPQGEGKGTASPAPKP